MMNRVVIDTDPGVDDAHAIMLAFAHPDTKVEALTVVAGNVGVQQAAINALVVLELLGKEVPVFAGCSDALVRPTPRRATSHGVDGLGDIGYPLPAKRASPEHAANALIRLANESPGELTLVAIGPLTNLALAVSLDPGLPQKYKRLVILGGAIRATGNSWNPAVEFNFYVDPEAAAITLRCWPGALLVPWETVMDHGLAPDQVEELCSIGTAKADFFRRSIRNRYLKQIPGVKKLFEPDPLAMAVALEPELISRSEARYIEVELGGNQTRGQVVVDWFDVTGQPPNANLVLEINRDRFFELMKLSLQ
jgi:inosine-uridine nucleoside N-ribohydrolase